ncbi:Glycylpeptide N-tetradecanoyltransferase [Wickerhamiella sorbophila]|uniref:Glycylpeptide N-tetradecanoyltransferase n=1 Tax=Wickerhamiella sorbophila TaxID=45607 RepID=A0A2T0FBX0_9ASCO|nr:Glycylpeptide N-tetradecanoyltransferase [Wickerhamiella sorbophila]PRT52498.1 Glycylpeptide N-tetradecanoyltransferase [Wickerhamiella sorbophila]
MPGKEEKKAKDSSDTETTRKLLENLSKMLASQKPDRHTPKAMDEHKFWKTQPVLPFNESVNEDGVIEVKTVDKVPKEPQQLPGDFEWCVLDVEKDSELEELYDLLYHNYIEDDDEQFRFQYSVPFLKWALKPPGWKKEWSVGVRAKTSNKLVAFISATPVTLAVRGTKIEAVEINFLCVHKKLRSKRLAPVMIKEITRQVNLKNIWQALYTGGTLLPTPFATCRYFHRTINWPKLYEVGFSYLPPGSTEEEQIERYKLDEEPSLEGFRKMTEKDFSQVQKLLEAYLSRFDALQVFSPEEFKHWFVSPVVHAYVVEIEGRIVDFVSYYGIDSTVLGNEKYPSLKVAYSYYYATAAPFEARQERLEKVFEATLIVAKQQGYDVFNALTLLDNPLFLDSLKFGAGDGLLYYYLFNYKTKPISGGIDRSGQVNGPGGVGVVML